MFARPILAPRFLLENSPKPMLPKPQPLPRTSPLLKDWGPGKPIPKGFRAPPDPSGNWYNPFTKESLNNDMTHPDGKGIDPHWDYIDMNRDHSRWFPDGRIVPKPHRVVLPPSPSDGSKYHEECVSFA